MNFIPSPIDILYRVKYQAVANKSGRMQYYKKEPGNGRIRIGRQDFIYAYNQSDIVAMKPLQSHDNDPVFQLEFYVKNNSN